MVHWRLHLKKPLPGRTQIPGLVPSRIAHLGKSELGSLDVVSSGVRTRLDEWFEFYKQADLPVDRRSGSSADCVVSNSPTPRLTVIGDCRNWDHVGRGLDSGIVEFQGDCGNYTANEMTGGQLIVHGSVGNFLASGLRGGSVVIHGDAGDYCAGQGSGMRTGMRGGNCVVHGSVGDRLGFRMRRGMVVVGESGDEGALQMIAGTILVQKSIGENWFVGSKRGTVVTTSVPKSHTSAHLSPMQSLQLSFLPILWKHLASLAVENTAFSGPYVDRLTFDMAFDGVAELLIPRARATRSN